MSGTGQVPGRIASAADLIAVAHALEQEAAARYRALSANMAAQGDANLAARFAELAALEDRHAAQVADRSAALLGGAPAAAAAGWDVPHGEDGASATLNAYQALAFAVRNEERAFAFFTYVAAEAASPGIRALAEDLARDELRHAAMLRRLRRAAFHADRPPEFAIPQTVAALHALARQRDAAAAAAHAALAQRLAAAGEREDAALFQRLAAEERAAAGGAPPGEVAALDSVADGLRWLEAGFDYYALVGERAQDAEVVAEAQRLAGVMVARLAQTGGARRNALLGG